MVAALRHSNLSIILVYISHIIVWNIVIFVKYINIRYWFYLVSHL